MHECFFDVISVFVSEASLVSIRLIGVLLKISSLFNERKFKTRFLMHALLAVLANNLMEKVISRLH